MRNFRKMKIWENGMNIVFKTYNLADNLPKKETYALISQITRATVSIPSNIAEGSGRESRKDFIRFLEISLGSSYELETQLLIIRKIYNLNEKEINKIIDEVNEVQKMIHGYIIQVRSQVKTQIN